tara:strand:- start:184 stop:594 length:411 start_codon:yes stop_codon:yes gene_type:complete
MIEEIKNIKSENRNIKGFGITFGAIFAALGLILCLRGIPYYHFFIYVSIFFTLVSLMAPSLLKPLFFIWMIFSLVFGWFMTNLILTFLFYFLMLPISVLMRLFGKTDLSEKNEIIYTYWDKRSEATEKNQDFTKQF